MKRILFIALAALLAAFAFSCTKEGEKTTDTMTLRGKTYKIDFTPGVMDIPGGHEFDADIHVLDEDFMFWASGIVGSFNLPTDKFMLLGMDDEITFKSGKVKTWLSDNGKYLYLVLDGVMSDGDQIKISVKSLELDR